MNYQIFAHSNSDAVSEAAFVRIVDTCCQPAASALLWLGLKNEGRLDIYDQACSVIEGNGVHPSPENNGWRYFSRSERFKIIMTGERDLSIISEGSSVDKKVIEDILNYYELKFQDL